MRNYNLFLKTTEFQITQMFNTFESKKNLVYLIAIQKRNGEEKKCVLKDYITFKNSNMKEAYILKTLKEKKITVPQIYYQADDFIIMEYIRGNTLLDTMEANEEKQAGNFDTADNTHMLYEVLKWMNDFYHLSKKLLGKRMILEDVNFRNFIITDRVYGIDFEDCKIGDRERDGGRFCAYLLTYNPAFTEWKIKLCRLAIKIMTEDFYYDRKEIIECLRQELLAIRDRRKIFIPPEMIKDIV
ncbi:hypothetical protein QBE52_14920 [Clostridiaceae bacterium 35-E11]